ncbi:MAG: ABC transporter transmembrane domain-containing protein [Acidimicrobiales bacterium]
MDEEGDSSRPSDLTVPPSRDGWRLILSTLRQQWRGIAVGVVVGLVWTAAKVAVPWLVQQAIDLGITPGDLEALRTWTIAIVIAAAVAATFTGLRRYWAFRESRRLETVLRDRLFAHVQRLHFAFHDRVQTGDLMSRANTDLQQVQNVVVLIPLTISNAVTVLAVAVLLVSIDPVLTVLALGSLPFLNLLGKRFSNRLHPTMIGLQRESAALATVVEESVSGIRAVKGFGAEELQRRRLATEADDIYDVAMQASRIRASFLPAMELLPNIGLIFVLGYGGWQVIAGQLSLGSLIAFNVYVALLIWPLRMLGMIIAQGQRAAASAQRVHEVLDTAPEITAPAHPQHLPARPEPASVATGVGRIELDAVRFGYGRPHPVLDGLDLVIEPGESVALVGATGSGKSTVARLLCRFYDVEAGRCASTASTSRPRPGRAAPRHLDRVRGDVPVLRHLAANIAFGRPDATDAEIHRRRAGGRGVVHRRPRRRLRLARRRAWPLAQRRTAPAHRHRPGHPRRSPRADPRRRHLRRRSDQGARDPRRPRPGDGPPHDAGHRPPTGDDRARRSCGAAPRGPGGRSWHPPRAARLERGLPAGPGHGAPRPHRRRRRHGSGVRRGRRPGVDRRGAGRGRGGVVMRARGIAPADQLDAAEARRVVRRAFRQLGPYRRDVIIGVVLVVFWTLATIAGPFLLSVGIDDGISQGDGRVLAFAVAGYILVAAASYGLYRAQIVVVARSGEGFLRDLRNQVFRHLSGLSLSFFDRTKAGVLVSRMTSDVDSLSELVQFGLLQLTMNVLLLVLSVVWLGLVSWQLLLICLVPVPFVVAASVKFQRDSNRAYNEVRDQIGDTLSHLNESIAGVREIQAFGREDLETERFAERSDGLQRAHMRSVFVQAWYLPVIEFAGLGTTALVVGFGGWLTVQGVVTIGTVAFFVLTLNNLFEPIQQLSQLFNTVQSAGAGLKKLFALLDTTTDVPERPGAVDLPAQGEIDVRDVSFGYADGAPVLRDVALTIGVGERLALVGPTGAGKSTLAKLIARFYDPTDGTVSFGGVDLRDATTASLRRRMVVVPQEGFLFSGSIRDNVRVGRADATDAEVDEALRTVGAYERFASLPEGLASEVRSGARACRRGASARPLARAALADPAVLVLDEATSSLDPGTEVLVEEAVGRLMAGRTVIVIAHRLSTAACRSRRRRRCRPAARARTARRPRRRGRGLRPVVRRLGRRLGVSGRRRRGPRGRRRSAVTPRAPRRARARR